jgi:hypothetical protein
MYVLIAENELGKLGIYYLGRGYDTRILRRAKRHLRKQIVALYGNNIGRLKYKVIWK